MSLISAAASDSKSAIRLDDATQYLAWAKWAITIFTKTRLLEEVPLDLPNYPLDGPRTLASDKEWWERRSKQETIKTLKDDGVIRPHLRLEVKFDDAPEGTVMDKKAWAKKETTAMAVNAEVLIQYVKVYDAEFLKTTAFLKEEARRNVFEALKQTLGHHYLSAIDVVKYGDALALLKEVHKFMPSDKEARKATLINQLWSSTFQQEGTNDLAVWINYLTTAVHELKLLGENTSDASKTSKLLSTLPLEIFETFKIVHGTKVKNFEETVSDLRTYSSFPEISSKLTQLSTSRAHRPEGSVFVSGATQKEVCRNFLKGKCSGSDCGRLHPSDAAPTAKRSYEPCKHCGKDGHPPEKCWDKFPSLKPPRGASLSKQTVPKNAEVVMQIVQDAVDNGQTKVDLQVF